MKTKISGFTALAAVAALSTGALGQGGGGQPNGDAPRAATELAKILLQRQREAVRLVMTGQQVQARVAIQDLMRDFRNDGDLMEGCRLLATSYRESGEFALAEQNLGTASAIYESSPSLRGDMPALRSVLRLDAGDLALARGDTAGAVSHYDAACEPEASASPRDRVIASRNAAFLCAELGRYAEASQRADALLASAAGSMLPLAEVIALRAAQASWDRQRGDLPAAQARFQAIWDAYSDRDDRGVFDAGIQLARWLPVPSHCAERLALARAVLAKVETARAAGTRSRLAPTSHEFNALEHQCQVIIANSSACPGEAAAAQRALGRARVLRPQ